MTVVELASRQNWFASDSAEERESEGQDPIKQFM